MGLIAVAANLNSHWLAVLAVLLAASAPLTWSSPRSSDPSVLDAIRKADEIPDLALRCVEYPQPTGVDWPKPALEAFCADEFAVLPDYETLIAWIETGDAARVDDLYSRLVESYFSGSFPEGALWKVYGYFQSSDERTARVTRRWLESSPDSGHALIARGAHHLAAASDARGNDIVADTPPENMATMLNEAGTAITLLRRGLELNPRIMPGYAKLINAHRLAGSNSIIYRWFQAALKQDPDTFYVRSALSLAMTSRCGGSLAEQERIARYAVPYLEKNPRLINLGAIAGLYRALDLYFYEDELPDDERVMPIFERAVARGPE